MSSAAASAASAAFKGSSQPANNKKTLEQKPQLHIKIDSNGLRVANDSISDNLHGNRPKLSPATTPLESPVFNVKRKDDHPSAPSDTEYFFSTANNSMSSHDFTEPVTRSRISVNTSPQDMLKQVRASINSKSVSGYGKDSGYKSQLVINDFRNSIEQRRQLVKRNGSPNCSTRAPLVNMAKEESSKVNSDSPSSEYTSDHLHPPPNMEENYSQSSFGSLESETRDRLSIPPIRVFDSEAASEEDLPLRGTPLSQAVSPIQISPSADVVVRGLGPGFESTHNLSILPSAPLNSAFDATEHGEQKSRLGRKPPPEIFEFSSDNRKASWSTSELSFGSDLEDSSRKTGVTFDNELKKLNIGSDELSPRNVNEKLKREQQQASYPFISKNSLLLQTDNETEEGDQMSLRNTQIGSGQPVKLKTTLRKMSKKKERRSIFNEDKPWKNHNDLDHMSEQQRKRYEGLWVSNKGLYLDKAVTRFVGVDYDREQQKLRQPTDRRELSEKEVSECAAKISLKTSYNFDTDDHLLQRHSLDEVDIHDLMHGIVVKRIWERSKLLKETLATVWDLVDYRKDGSLNKAEFLVGMWLVDQCLYGRKLPKTLPSSVWNSAGSIRMNIVLKKKRR